MEYSVKSSPYKHVQAILEPFFFQNSLTSGTLQDIFWKSFCSRSGSSWKLCWNCVQSSTKRLRILQTKVHRGKKTTNGKKMTSIRSNFCRFSVDLDSNSKGATTISVDSLWFSLIISENQLVPLTIWIPDSSNVVKIHKNPLYFISFRSARWNGLLTFKDRKLFLFRKNSGVLGALQTVNLEFSVLSMEKTVNPERARRQFVKSDHFFRCFYRNCMSLFKCLSQFSDVRVQLLPPFAIITWSFTLKLRRFPMIWFLKLFLTRQLAGKPSTDHRRSHAPWVEKPLLTFWMVCRSPGVVYGTFSDRHCVRTDQNDQ